MSKTIESLFMAVDAARRVAARGSEILGAPVAAASVDPSRYQESREAAATAFDDELMFVKLRYKDPEGSESKLLSTPVRNSHVEFDSAPNDFRFATGVASS